MKEYLETGSYCTFRYNRGKDYGTERVHFCEIKPWL